MDYEYYFRVALRFLILDIEYLKDVYNELPLGEPFYDIVNEFYKNMKEIYLNSHIETIEEQFYIIHKESPEGQQFKKLILDKKDNGYPTSAPEYDMME